MSYKPKYCCQCGEKIDRAEWQLWTNRRFCELCQSEYGIYDWLRRAFIATSLIFGLFGIGSFFAKPEKAPTIASKQFAVDSSNSKGEIVNQKIVSQSLPSDVQTAAQVSNSALSKKSQVAPAAKTRSNRIEDASNEVSEAVYFCGAQTKKGTLCSRRVKGGGRCWQHAGQPAMLPQDKLIAAR